MKACVVYVALALQGELKKSDELIRAEIKLFTEFLGEYGLMVLDLPGYTAQASKRWNGNPPRIEFVLKLHGTWTTFWLEKAAAKVLILHGR